MIIEPVMEFEWSIKIGETTVINKPVWFDFYEMCFDWDWNDLTYSNIHYMTDADFDVTFFVKPHDMVLAINAHHMVVWRMK